MRTSPQFGQRNFTAFSPGIIGLLQEEQTGSWICLSVDIGVRMYNAQNIRNILCCSVKFPGQLSKLLISLETTIPKIENKFATPNAFIIAIECLSKSPSSEIF